MDKSPQATLATDKSWSGAKVKYSDLPYSRFQLIMQVNLLVSPHKTLQEALTLPL